MRQETIDLLSAPRAVQVQTFPASSGGILKISNAALLGVAERPDFVALHSAGFDLSDRLIVELSAGFPRIHQQLGYRVDGHASDPAGGAHGTALQQHVDDQATLFVRQLIYAPIHTEHIALYQALFSVSSPSSLSNSK